MFKMTRQADYAVQFLMELEVLPKETVLSLRTFSQKSGISFLFLQRIATALRSAGMVRAKSGKSGGYALAVPLENISMKDVLQAVDGPYGVATCMTKGRSCTKDHECPTKPAMKSLQAQIVTLLEQTPVKAFAKQ